MVRALLTALLAVLWSLGWVAGETYSGAEFIVSGVRLGWRDARGVSRGATR